MKKGRVGSLLTAVLRRLFAPSEHLSATAPTSRGTEANSANRIARTVGLALLLVLPALAQTGPAPTPLSGNPAWDIKSGPVARDQNGNPIQGTPPTEAEREAERKENERRADKQRAEDERKATEEHREADENRATEHLAEEKKFHDRIMTALYVGLAIVAVGFGLRLLKRR